MKKNYLVCAFLLLTLPGICQKLPSFGERKFGVFGGPQVTYSRYIIRNSVQKNEIKYGFQAGVGLKIPFEGKLFFTPLGFYSLKGYKVTLTQSTFPPDSFATDNNTTIHTFEVAALLQYDLGDQPGHFFFRAGPSIDFQLFGKENFNRSNAGPVSRNMKFSFGDYGHFGANILLHFGYETSSGFVIYAQYTLGIGSINNADNGPTINHRAAGITIGKYFDW